MTVQNMPLQVRAHWSAKTTEKLNVCRLIPSENSGERKWAGLQKQKQKKNFNNGKNRTENKGRRQSLGERGEATYGRGETE